MIARPLSLAPTPEDREFDTLLNEHGLDRYIPLLRLHAVRRDVLRDLTKDDLLEIGIDSLGHRFRILKLINQLVPPSTDNHPTASGPKPRLFRPAGEGLTVDPTREPGRANSVPENDDTAAKPSDSGRPTLHRAPFSTPAVPSDDEARSALNPPNSALPGLSATLEETQLRRLELCERQVRKLSEMVLPIRSDWLRRHKEGQPLPDPLSPNTLGSHPLSSHPLSSNTLSSNALSSNALSSNANSHAPSPSTLSPHTNIASLPSLAPLPSLAALQGISPLPSLPSQVGPLPAPSEPSSATSSVYSNSPVSPHDEHLKAQNAKVMRPRPVSIGPHAPLGSRSPQDSYFGRPATSRPPTTPQATSNSTSASSANASANANANASSSLASLASASSSVASTPGGVADRSESLPVQSSDQAAHGLRNIRCKGNETAGDVLRKMARRYDVPTTEDTSRWRLQIAADGDYSRDLLDSEFPLKVFRKLQEQGRRPMFHIVKLPAAKPPMGTYI